MTDGSPSLWQTVVNLLLHRIRTGKYKVGELLPREIDLAEELKVSRNTVREAMRVLAQDGLVQRRKRAGTVVTRTEKERPAGFNLDPLQSLERLQRSTISSVRKAPRAFLPEAVSRAFPKAEAGKWVRINLVRHAKADGKPVSSTELYLHPRLEQLAPMVGPRQSVFRLIEEVTGERVRRIDTAVRPCQLSLKQSNELGAPAGALGLIVSRRVMNEAGELIEVAETTLPEGGLELEFSFDMPPAAKAAPSRTAAPGPAAGATANAGATRRPQAAGSSLVKGSGSTPRR